MDDDLGPVAVDPRADAVGRVQVERRAIPGDRSGRAGERGVGEGRHEGTPQSTAGAGHRDPHQSAAVPVGAAVDPARRWPYWRVVVGVPVAGPARPPPGLVGPVPVDGLGQARLERPRRRPAKRGQLRAIHRVASVVAGPILHGPDQRPGLAEPLQQQRDRVPVRLLGPAGDVVDLARFAVAQHEVHAAGVIGHVQPVASLQAIAVHRQRLVVERIRDEQRDQLLRMLVRAVGVGTAGRDRVQAVGDDVTADQQLPGGLGGGIRRAWRQRRVLGRVADIDGAVDLVRRDLQVARPMGRRERRVQQHVDADDPGPQERLGIQDGAVHVRLGGEVDDRVRLGDERCDQVRVRDVALDEPQAVGRGRIRAHRVQVRFVARVGELVEDRDGRPVPSRQDVADVARADEPGPARDQQPPEGAVRHAIVSPPAGRRVARGDRRRRRRPPVPRRAGATARSRRPSSGRRRPG